MGLGLQIMGARCLSLVAGKHFARCGCNSKHHRSQTLIQTSARTISLLKSQDNHGVRHLLLLPRENVKTPHCLLPLPWTGSWGLPDKILLHTLALSLFLLTFWDAQQASHAVLFFPPQTAINSCKTNSKHSLHHVSKIPHVLRVCVCAHVHNLTYCGYRTAFVRLHLIFYFLVSKAVICDSECVTGQNHLQRLHKSASSLLP